MTATSQPAATADQSHTGPLASLSARTHPISRVELVISTSTICAGDTDRWRAGVGRAAIQRGYASSGM